MNCITNKNNNHSHVFVRLLSLFALFAVFVSHNVSASDEDKKENRYSEKGADTCLKCHDEDYKRYRVMDIFYSKHGNRDNPRSPMAQLQCEACHGPIGDHEHEPKVGQRRVPVIVFGKRSPVSIRKQNSMCLACHNDKPRFNWAGSQHQSNTLACVECHVLHTRNEPMQSATQQVDKCLNCHNNRRAEFQRTSAHPVRSQKMRCSDCHNAHGSAADKLLVTQNRNDLCYRCHAEKRGPLLWTHAPVAEDCGICHEHHGSVNPALLKKRPPLLCQQCHSILGHPAVARTSTGLPDQSPSTMLIGKSCLNCHYQVHGSNHPSGVKLMR